MEKKNIKKLVKPNLPRLHTLISNVKQDFTISYDNLPRKSHQRSSDSLTSPQRLKNLRKLYFQSKSNAYILKNSPYFTYRNQQKKVIQHIKKYKIFPDQKQIKHIEQYFSLSPQQKNKIFHIPASKIKVKIYNFFKDNILLHLQARTVKQLKLEISKQLAVQELKRNGKITKTYKIGGFQPKTTNIICKYLLSLEDITVYQINQINNTCEVQLKPWFYQKINKKVSLNDFRLIRCLGSGGFSLVYLVQDKWQGQMYAMKMIQKQFIIQSDRQTIIENERWILGQLDSKFTTKLKFSFENCPGGQLFNLLKKVKRMKQQQAKFYFLQVLIALDYIHSKDIIYRDLKPQNILIAKDGHVKIADFGLAKPLQGASQASSFCGSPEYMAPQMLNKNGHNNTLDYYCLGALLYELVVGVPPFYSLQHQQIYQGILHQQISFPSHVVMSSQLKNLIKNLLIKDKNKRLGNLYGIKQILIHPWIGKINRKDIQNHNLIPPFKPNEFTFNFDQSQIIKKQEQAKQKLMQDFNNQQFTTYFNQQFYYADQNILSQILKHKINPIKRSFFLRSLSKQKKQTHKLSLRA